MTTQSLIRQSDLLNQLVIDRSTLEELGRIEVLWMYPQAHRVLGFVCKSGFLGSQKLAFQLSQLEAFGTNGILTHARPEKTQAEKVRRLESLIDHEIWSDEGNRVGKITDCLFDLQTGEIVYYLFISAGWLSIVGEVYQLPPSQILSFSKRRVLISETALANLEIYQAGISQKLTQAKAHFKEEVLQEWTSVAKRAETRAEQAKGQFQQLSEQAKEQAQRFSLQFQQKAQVLNEQVKERTQTLLEQAKEKSQTLGKQVEEGIETLTVQAEEIFDSVEGLPRSANRSASAKTSATDHATTDHATIEEDEDWWIDDAPPPKTPISPLEDDNDEDWWADPAPPSPQAATAETLTVEPSGEEDDDEPWI